MVLAIESIGELPSLSLTDLDSTWTTNRRYDTKFIVERTAMDSFFTETSSSYAALEVDGLRAFTYKTTYFDTLDLQLYRDHAQRRRRRIKVRTRHYVESNRTRLEVKAKLGNGQTQKVLFENYADLSALEVPLVDQAISELNSSPRYYNLASQLTQAAITTFERSTVINRNAIERLTFDSSLILDAHGNKVQLSPDLVLVEIKSPHRISDTARELRHRGIHPTSFSKYCATIESTQEARPRIHTAQKLSRTLRSVT